MVLFIEQIKLSTFIDNLRIRTIEILEEDLDIRIEQGTDVAPPYAMIEMMITPMLNKVDGGYELKENDLVLLFNELCNYTKDEIDIELL